MLVKSIITIIALSAFLYAALIVTMSYLQERLIFFPEVLSADYKFGFKSEYEEHILKLNGETVHSLLFKAPKSKGVILYFHGNAGSMQEWGAVAEELVSRTQWDVWMLDFPGYGKSRGKINSQEQLLELGKILFAEAKKIYGPDRKILIFGRSVGTGIATHVASENKVAGLVLETPYFSILSLAKTRYSWIPEFAVRYPMRSDLWIKSVTAPILIFHGTSDRVIPYEQGKRLSEIAKGVTMITLEGRNHSDLAQEPLYWNSLAQFLKGLE